MERNEIDRKKVTENTECFEMDLIIAKGILYDPEQLWKRMKSAVNQSAYHSGQAIEKMLKYTLSNLDYEKYNNLRNTHSIPALMVAMEDCQRGFVANYEFILHNAREITKCQYLRYDRWDISVDDAFALMQCAKDMRTTLILGGESRIHNEDKIMLSMQNFRGVEDEEVITKLNDLEKEVVLANQLEKQREHIEKTYYSEKHNNNDIGEKKMFGFVKRNNTYKE